MQSRYGLGGKDDLISLEEIKDKPSPKRKDPLPELNRNEKAINGVATVGPHVYELTGLGDEVSFLVLGCHGSGEPSQIKVAGEMDAFIRRTGKKPDFILFVGDNLYDHGAVRPDDPAFKKYFHDIYYKPELTALNDIPSFAILGNHDANLHSAAILSYAKQGQGRAAELQEVACTYLPDGTCAFQTVDDLVAFFSQEKLSISELQRWNMPYYFYSLIANDLQIFCLNSNTLLRDFLNYKKNIPEPNSEINQIAWLIREYKRAKDNNKTINFALHHPIFPQGKRYLKKNLDTHLFLDAKEIAELKDIFGTDTDSYYELMALMFEELETWPALAYTAHEHSMSYFNNLARPQKEDATKLTKQLVSESAEDPAADFRKIFTYPQRICQVGVGGGGGNLEKRKNFVSCKNTGFFQTANGFAYIQHAKNEPKKINIEFPMNYGQRFNNFSHLPIREPNQPEIIELFRKIVYETSHDYFSQLEPSKITSPKEDIANYYFGQFTNLYSKVSSGFSSMVNLFTGKHPPEDYDYIQEILAYLNASTLPSLTEVITFFHSYTNKLIENTFMSLFYEKLEVYKMRFDLKEITDLLNLEPAKTMSFNF